MSLYDWARRWGASPECLRDLQQTLGLYTPTLAPDSPAHGKSEAWVQSEVRLEASQLGVRLWRNNVGVLKDQTGRPVRYGLANDSAALNAVLKSSDLIGWEPVAITPAHVGHTLARFVCREIKAPGWQYTGTQREAAQWAWLSMVAAAGGNAAFATGRGTLTVASS